MKKNFVLDTNVLLHDPQAIFAFEDNNVCIPIYVIEEIDNFKKDQSELGQNAREVSRILDTFRKRGNLREGVTLPKAGKVMVLFTEKDYQKERMRSFHKDISISHLMDNLIIETAIDLMKKEGNVPTIFVTKDTNLRIRADAIGLKAVDYDKERKDISEIYSGTGELTLPNDEIKTLTEGGEIRVSDENNFLENQYLLIRDISDENHTVLGRFTDGKISRIYNLKEPVWGIKPRNKEQYYAMDALLRDEIKLVTLVGKAGTGKTLLAIAAGMKKVIEENVYIKLLISRPIFPMGKDIGYLPGDIEEKLNPWMQPIQDNVELLLELSKSHHSSCKSYKEIIKGGLMEIEPLTYIRGRSIPNQYIIVDEAQNLTPHEVKTVLTRVGHGTKMVLTGDPYQIDNPYVDSVNNGLAYLAEKFKKEKLSATVTLIKGERSPLAELSANIL